MFCHIKLYETRFKTLYINALVADATSKTTCEHQALQQKEIPKRKQKRTEKYLVQGTGNENT
jgi:hypothetical protein